MNKGINKTILLGNVTSDIEFSTFENDKKRASFNFVTNEISYSQNGKYEHSEFHKVVAWGGLAEMISKNFFKGIPAYIEGKVRTRIWETKGGKKYITEIIADTVVMLPNKGKNTPQVEELNDTDLPF